MQGASFRRKSPEPKSIVQPSTMNFEADAPFGFTAHPVANVPDLFLYADTWHCLDFSNVFSDAVVLADAFDALNTCQESGVGDLGQSMAGYPSSSPHIPLDNAGGYAHTLPSLEQAEVDRIYDEFLKLYTNVNEDI